MPGKMPFIFERMLENCFMAPKTALILIKTRKAGYEGYILKITLALILLVVMFIMLGKIFNPESAAQTASSCITQPMGPFS